MIRSPVHARSGACDIAAVLGLIVSLAGCNFIAGERRPLIPGQCDARATHRRVDLAIGGPLLAAGIFAASRPAGPDGDSEAGRNSVVGGGTLSMVVGIFGTMLSLPFVGSWLAGRDEALRCEERARTPHEVAPTAPDPWAAQREADLAPGPAAAQPTTPDHVEPAGASAGSEAGSSGGWDPPAPSARAVSTSKAFDTEWTDWYADRELAEKLARSMVVTRSHEECRIQHDGARSEIGRLGYGTLECEDGGDGGAERRCRYRNSIATCEKQEAE